MAKSTKSSGDKLFITAEKRETFGKKLRKMRHDGKIPANIYGPSFKSLSISLEGKDFNKVYRIAEETGIIYIKVDKQEVPALIKNVQIHPVSHLLLHIDFRKVDLAQKIETKVPIKIIGEAPAVKEKGGVLLTQTDEITVEALPQDIPHQVEIDISKMVEIGEEIKVADLGKSTKYDIKDDADKIIVSVIAHKEESLAPETTAAAPEVITEKPAEGEEGAEAAPAEEGKKEETKQPEKPADKAPEAKHPQKEDKK